MPNTYITTHSGAGTGEAEANCADMAISELKDYLENGNIANSVNYPACNMGKARAASRIACLHANVPNMIGQITAILAKDNANVQRMVNESAGETPTPCSTRTSIWIPLPSRRSSRFPRSTASASSNSASRICFFVSRPAIGFSNSQLSHGLAH